MKDNVVRTGNGEGQAARGFEILTLCGLLFIAFPHTALPVWSDQLAGLRTKSQLAGPGGWPPPPVTPPMPSSGTPDDAQTWGSLPP